MLLQSNPSLISPFNFTKSNFRILILGVEGGEDLRERRRKWGVGAVEKKGSEYEVDPEKAREALQKLDQQLQSISQKSITPPRKRVSSSPSDEELRLMKEVMKEDVPEFSGSSLFYSAFLLLAITILYNIFFLTVIKPSIDGPEDVVDFSITSVK
ncbi:hypothetical protein RJ641_034171 [Dillenia turbinata]|uniref:Uncharacterized protein n=1 Tax=Dillenia turbinata TaxID=194707 RepID=A0AAN8ZGH2_9MAGN